MHLEGQELYFKKIYIWQYNQEKYYLNKEIPGILFSKMCKDHESNRMGKVGNLASEKS